MSLPFFSSETFKTYRPLWCVFIFACLLGFFANTHMGFLNRTMGFFLCLLALLKFFDRDGFAKSFQKYDLIAARMPTYAKIYPFLEVCLGLSFISGIALPLASLILFFLMGVSVFGILAALNRQEKLKCACVGSVFVIPLGKVTLIENSIMGIMALLDLLRIMH